MKTKYFHLYGNAVDSKGENHVVTVVGKLECGRKPVDFTEKIRVEYKPNAFVDGEVKYRHKVFNRRLTVGLSICHPTDTFSEERGIELAKSRIESGNGIGHLETSSVTMLTDDAVMAELLVKLQYITSHIDDYLPDESEQS